MSAISPVQGQQETIAQINRRYWDTAASHVFKDGWVNDLQNQIAEFLVSSPGVDWLKIPPKTSNRNTKMLDYACGNGLPSRTLKPHFDRCIGIDVSANMLSKYNKTARELGLKSDEMFGIRGDLFSDPPDIEGNDAGVDDEALRDFDLVALCMALHHMEDVQVAVDRLAARLKPGGVLLIIDWAMQDTVDVGDSAHQPLQTPEHGQEHRQHGHHEHLTLKEASAHHPAAHTITHDSFTKQQMQAMFQHAGCTDMAWRLAEYLSDVPGARTGKMQLFWARATKE